ncbi:MAG: LacI family DNA-binding transcriptional regulator [Clostridia bacterium]
MDIRKIAKLCGVSTATVSRALNRPEVVKKATLEKVLAIVKEHNFSLNPIAQAMTIKETKKITMVVPTIHNPYFMELVDGVTSILTPRGFYLHIYNTNNDLIMEKDILRQIIDRKINHMVDGLILAGAGSFPPGYKKLLAKINVPVVAIEILPEDVPIDCVLVDDTIGVTMILDYIFARKDFNIGFIFGPSNVPTTQRRMEVVQKYYAAHHLSLASEYVVQSRFDNLEESLQATKRLLALPKPPNVIYGSSDIQITAALRAIHELGLNCPKDVAVIGGNDNRGSAYTIPALTTMHGHNEEIGKIAAATLVNRIYHPDLPIQRILLPPALIIRESC